MKKSKDCSYPLVHGFIITMNPRNITPITPVVEVTVLEFTERKATQGERFGLYSSLANVEGSMRLSGVV